MKARNILLTTDFSAEARHAYATAADLARRFNGTVHLVHVAERTPFHFSASGFGAATVLDDLWKDVERRLHEEARHDSLASVNVRPFLISDKSFVDGLAHFESEHGIDVTVLAPHGKGFIQHAILGSTAGKVVRALKSPVLVCKTPEWGTAGAPFSPQRVLVPFDFSANARATLPMVQDLASAFLGEFIFFFVVEPIYPIFSETAGYASYDFLERTARETPKWMEAQFAELCQEELKGVNARLEFADGLPAQEVLRKAASSKADLILMATHGWTGMKHFLLGSVAESVLRKAPCSVLTVRSGVTA